jgi:NADH dehydrogenase FAD-containing subunit
MLDIETYLAYPETGPLPKIETWVMTPLELKTVFNNSQPGDTTVYAVGDLAYERQMADGKQFLAVHDTAELAAELHIGGKARLTQKRLGPHKYEYRVTKRSA